VFSYSTPSAGWWGFAALNTAPETVAFEGEEKAVELGAVIWVHFEQWTGQ
jgi:cobalt/nickel transport protein